MSAAPSIPHQLSGPPGQDELGSAIDAHELAQELTTARGLLLQIVNADGERAAGAASLPALGPKA